MLPQTMRTNAPTTKGGKYVRVYISHFLNLYMLLKKKINIMVLTLIINNSTQKQGQQSLPDRESLQQGSDETSRLGDLGEDGGISGRGDEAPIDRGHDG